MPASIFDPYALPYPRLEARVVALGGAPVHALRWFRSLHRSGNPDPALVPQLGRRLAAELRAAMAPRLPDIAQVQTSSDGTVKLGLRLHDGEAIESVLIPDGARLTLCVSSQAGCAVGCGFCATGRLGLVRNLSAGEIVGQVVRAREHASAAGLGPLTNIVFMGMGEPLQNWPAVRDAVELLNAPNAYNFSRHKITVSTSGVLPRLEAVVREARTDLAFSMHATDDAGRSESIPLNRAYPLADVIAELKRLALHHGARIMVQYLLLAGRNDSPRHARELWSWLENWPCHINLLEYNPVAGLPYARPNSEVTARFKAELLALGARVYHRESRGRDIAGACGQLANVSRPENGGRCESVELAR
jgi:23S rRNA (adenine2503-C2)-methyltransferase